MTTVPVHGAAGVVPASIERPEYVGRPPQGKRPVALSWPWKARAACFRLFAHFARFAASRTFCTAGSVSPIRTAMMATVTRSSMRVKAGRVISWT